MAAQPLDSPAAVTGLKRRGSTTGSPHLRVSLDGFIADESGGVGPLFDYHSNGHSEITLGDEERTFRVTDATEGYLRRFAAATVGCVVIGRRLFDLTNGWNGRPATGEAVFVVTHHVPTDWPFRDAPFTFVTDGVEAAIDRAKHFAGERDVAVNAGSIGGQALQADLIDQIHLNLVPVVLGSGVRFFAGYGGGVTRFEDPEVIEGSRVTHLIYRRRR
jgi:dihydrofolate reductase